ncbi:MAG TPA: enoyl-[acyl-carrier-protein] reductase FabI [Gammaproteobacteria bacterium]|nr:enoyl-[acyl-carrier-protein] reductase FabI [Gammaproteobacteria bacterium]
MGMLEGKRVLIVGIASNRSIAAGIANAMHREGAELAFTYQNDKLKSRVEKIAEECGSNVLAPCDVTDDTEIERVFKTLGSHWDGVDGIVHSVAFAPGDHLEGDYLENLTRDGFKLSQDISAYSFAALAKAARPLMRDRQSALLTLTYLGSQRVMPNYNVMGVAKASLEANVRYMAAALGPDNIRVNAISAGPIRTLAASGIGDFRKLLSVAETMAPMRRNVTIEEVGNVAAFLCSDLASAVTGEIMYVDNGINIMGATPLEK